MVLSRVSLPPAIFIFQTKQCDFFLALGLNPYDVRKKCNRIVDGPLCYKQMRWIEIYMNQPHVKVELGANENIEFQACNEEVR
jgi:cathepsin A (carboxypeptidase C)